MFKKVVVVVLAIVFLAGVSFAQESKEILTYSIENTSTTSYKVSYIPVTSIYPNSLDMILGFTVLPIIGGNSETVGMLYDVTAATGGTELTATINTVELMGEAEALNELSATMWFPYPRTIRNQVCVKQGPWTTMIVYFIRG